MSRREGLDFVLCDVFVTIAWIGFVIKGKLPVGKIALICNPVILSLLGQLIIILRKVWPPVFGQGKGYK